jgi:nucleotide-binding universal stress UspA family protein
MERILLDPGAREEATMQVKTILVPVDFSDCALTALKYAEFVAKTFQAQIDVLHVWEPPRYVLPDITVQIPGQADQTLMDFARSEAGKDMEKFLMALEDDGTVEVRGRLESGDPTDRILELAAKGEYDMIVMGTHGRTGLSHLFLGSVAEKVVRRASCPVLTIRRSDSGKRK